MFRTMAAALGAAAAFVASAAPMSYPPAAKKAVTDTYYGEQVADDYRWLENGADPQVKAWSQEQLKATRQVLDAVPMRAELAKRFKELYETAPARHFEFVDRGQLFALKRQPPKNQPMLVVMKSAADVASERVVVDPNTLNAKGTTAIDWYVPSLDGRYVAVSLSENGSEDGTVHVIDTKTGKETGDLVPRAQYPTGGGSLEWDEKATGFYYTRYPQGQERSGEDVNFYQQVYFHKLGTPAAKDIYVIGKEFPRIAETFLRATRDGKYLLASVANGDGGEYAYYLRGPDRKWTQVAGYADKIRRMVPGRDARLYALSLKDSPRGKVLAIPMDKPALANATVLVPESADTIQEVAPANDRIYVDYMAGGPSEVRVFSLAGKPYPSVPAESIASVGVDAVLDNGDVLIGAQSYVTPPAIYLFSPKAGKYERTQLVGKYSVSFEDAQVVREMATSKDGTKVPVNIIMKKGTKLDGSNPTLLYGYGGYGVNLTPFFSLTHRVWLDHGGVMVYANLRGGGEFGEAWHLAGNLTKKQNVFDDMIAAAEHLIKRRYTKPEKLAAMGGSNGGLLMGAVLTQRPDLFRAVVSDVGIYDMLRVELTPNGAFNVTEFGTVKDPAQYKALRAYSPYHRVKDGTAYPAVLMLTGENDGRVDPYNSRKMAARLQAASSSDRPILLRVSMDTGHGIGTSLSNRVAEEADRYAFLMSQLGMQ